MAELTQKERLQPSLLDRLTDEEPGKSVESRDERVLSMHRLRESVIRDLHWLLNATRLESLDKSPDNPAASRLDDYPLAQRSVINYGIPDLTGFTASGVDPASLERLVRESIWDYEPRLLRSTVKVRVASNQTAYNHNAIAFHIEAELWAQPVPQRIYLKTELDLEIGAIKVSENVGASG